MHRAALLATLLVACTGGPLDDTSGDDTADTSDTSDTDTGGDTADTSDTGNPDADIGLWESCAEAQGGIKLVPGDYNGTTDDWGGDFEGTCFSGDGPGPDKMFAIDVPDDTRVTIDFKVQGNDARIYLLENCNNPGVCVDYTNSTAGNQGEHLEWTNESGATTTLYVVLDTRDSAETGETWTLSVAFETYTPPTLLEVADTCEDLGDVTPISGTGTFAVSLTGFGGDYNAGDNSDCTDYSSGGVDAVVPVVVPDGATLSLTWGHPTCDASLYVVTTCGDQATCVTGSDDFSSGSTESATWQNRTGREATVTVVLDHFGTSCVPSVGSPATLGVTITPGTSVAVDTCAEAEALTPVTSGDHYVLLEAAGDDVDLADAASSCTGQGTPGADVFFPVTVPAGQELRGRFVHGGGDAALYVLTDCADADACIAGADLADPEEVRWINEGTTAATVYVAIDSRHAPEDADQPRSGTLSLDVFPPLGDIRLADRCSDLPAVPQVGEGTHAIVMEDFVNNIDLGAGNQCTGITTPGVDGMVSTRVRPGWTLDVAYDAGCDGAVYLLTTCVDGVCLDGADTNAVPETVSWTNDLGATTEVLIVMDAYWSCRPTRAFPGELTVALTPPPSVAAETCEAALALPPVTEGIHPIDLSAATGDFDASSLTPPGCGDVATSTGAEVYVPIEVPAGNSVDLSFDPDRGDPSLYLLADCDTTPVCIDGVDAGNPEMVTWLNDTGVDATIVAVIDTNAADATADEPQSGFLEVFFDFPSVPLTAADTCDAPPSVVPGRYEIDLTGFVDDLDLDDGAGVPCTDGQITPGRDGFVAIEVSAGQTLSVEWDASISTSGIRNGSVYLLDACDVDACLAGADAADPEQTAWTNTTGQAATVTIGVDAVSPTGGPDKGLLTVSLSP